MIQRAQYIRSTEGPSLTEDELWYLEFLQWAEEMTAQGILPCHDRPLSTLYPLQESLAAKGLVRYEGPQGPIPNVVLTDAGRALDPGAFLRPQQPGIHPDAVPEMEVCHACASVVGPFSDDGTRRVQRGSCPDHARPEGEPRWEGWDIQMHVDLCRCCGRVPLKSGSRYSVWFCDLCKDQVGLLNGRHGRCIVPIGPHSVHSGHLLRGTEAADPVEVHTFVQAVTAVARVHDFISAWARTAVRLNLEAIGVLEAGRVPLGDYWPEARDRVDPAGRFREMCAYLERVGRDAQDPGARRSDDDGRNAPRRDGR